MRNGLFGAISVAAVIVTAACNGGGEGNGSAATIVQQNETVSNVASGVATREGWLAATARPDEALGP